jgi:hypothetical protein
VAKKQTSWKSESSGPDDVRFRVPLSRSGPDEAFLKTAISHYKKQRNFPAKYLHDIPIVKYMTGFFAAHF